MHGVPPHLQRKGRGAYRVKEHSIAYPLASIWGSSRGRVRVGGFGGICGSPVGLEMEDCGGGNGPPPRFKVTSAGYEVGGASRERPCGSHER